ncbi:MAG: 5-formyltetrahydrofolate cyclo-ligase [Planctomycetia bacterium]|nr:5-formyltetrahydrofolate cyclo-ligase [Planctomycetia bacterium]
MHAPDQDERKAAIRAEARARRRDRADKDAASRRICGTLAARPEFLAARTVLFYVHFGDEVRTQAFLAETLRGDKRVAVPYCVGRRLELFRLTDMNELAEGTFTILEPRPELRDRPERRVDVAEVDLVVVPGVAFDARGGRLGHGQGYYDRLLKHARPDATLVALAFECQMFAEIPVGPHDVVVDWVITEEHVYQGRGR